MIAALLIGLVIGFGCWLAVTTFSPARASLATALQRLDRVAEPARDAAPGWAGVCGRTAQRLTGANLYLGSVDARRDLNVAGLSPEIHVGRKVLWACTGLLAGPALAALLLIAGVGLPLAVPAWITIVVAVGGWFLPDAELRRVANERRREFRQSLGAYSDLVVLLLAADEGVTGALEHAASGGDSWPFVELRRVLSESRLTAVTPWMSLRSLGERFGIPELEELASAAQLAGNEGASVRQSIIAKARTLRDRALAAEESEAERSSTRMVFPLLLLVCSFLLFIGYPALVGVLGA